jgi:uncharacterized protein (DUF1697 family)
MKFVALLRGINVGGNSLVKMSELKKAFEQAEFTNVSTYINSGNVIFEDTTQNPEYLSSKVEAFLEKQFFRITTVVLSHTQLKEVVEKAPANWKNEDLRKYVAFLKTPLTPDEVIKSAEVKEGIDRIEKGPGVVYMSTKMEGLTKSSFPKLITKNIYKNMTMRNYTTVTKVLSLMDAPIK